jgi:hypothetical protein
MEGSGGQGRCACDPGPTPSARRCRPIWTREQHGLVAVRGGRAPGVAFPGAGGFRAGSPAILAPDGRRVSDPTARAA